MSRGGSVYMTEAAEAQLYKWWPSRWMQSDGSTAASPCPVCQSGGGAVYASLYTTNEQMPRRSEPVPKEEGSVPGGNEQMPLPPEPAQEGRDRVGGGAKEPRGRLNAVGRLRSH
jgi:hypothetical protein